MTTLQIVGLCAVVFGAAWILAGALAVAASRGDEQQRLDIPDWVNRDDA
jgi:hypothetical protein